MDINFDDNLEAELPFLRTNPALDEEVEVVELDSEGNVVDIVATDPEYLGELEDDYYLQPVIDPVTDEMPFEMEELGFAFGAKGSVSTKGGIRGKTTSRTTRRPAKKGPGFAVRIRAAQQAAIKRGIEAARKAAAKRKRRPAKKPARKPVSRRRPTRKPVRKPRSLLMKYKPEGRPLIVAKPKLHTAGVMCGCGPQLARIEKMLKAAAVQRLATSEHNTIVGTKKFRRRTIGQLTAILRNLPNDRRIAVIKAACGVGANA